MLDHSANNGEPIDLNAGLLDIHWSDEPARQRLMASSHRLFFRFGIAKVTVDELCREVRISKKTFYKLYQDKLDLARAIVLACMGSMAVELQSNQARLENDRARLQALLVSFLQQSRRCFSQILLADIRGMMPELWRQLDQHRQLLIDYAHQVIATGQAEGNFRDDVDAGVLAKVIALTVEKVFEPATLLERGISSQSGAEALFTVLLDGLDTAKKVDA